MHSRSDNIKFTSHNNVSEVADQLFDSIRSDFVLDSVYLMYYKCHKVNFRGGGDILIFQSG